MIYQVDYRVIVDRTKKVEADSIALAEEKVRESEDDFIDEVLSVSNTGKYRKED